MTDSEHQPEAVRSSMHGQLMPMVQAIACILGGTCLPKFCMWLQLSSVICLVPCLQEGLQLTPACVVCRQSCRLPRSKTASTHPKSFQDPTQP